MLLAAAGRGGATVSFNELYSDFGRVLNIFLFCFWSGKKKGVEVAMNIEVDLLTFS